MLKNMSIRKRIVVMLAVVYVLSLLLAVGGGGYFLQQSIFSVLLPPIPLIPRTCPTILRTELLLVLKMASTKHGRDLPSGMAKNSMPLPSPSLPAVIASAATILPMSPIPVRWSATGPGLVTATLKVMLSVPVLSMCLLM